VRDSNRRQMNATLGELLAVFLFGFSSSRVTK